MRVLHLNAGNLYGGVETLLMTFARNARLCPGFESDFGVCFPGRFRDELESAGATVYDLGEVRFSRFWTVWRARRRLRQLLSEHRFDAVVCHMPWNYALFASTVRRAGKKLVFWQHGPALGNNWEEKWARRIRPDLAISNSRFTAASLPRLFPDVRVEVIYCPVTCVPPDSSARFDLRRELGVSDNTVVIVQVGRMESWKGHSLHLRALAELKDLDQWVCWMVGGAQRVSEKAYVERLRQEAGELGISDRVRFLGERSDVPRILSAADIFCQPNLEGEPFGIVFIEALSAGLPVVTTRVGGGMEIITGAEGCLAEPGDAHSVAAHLRRLIDCPAERRVLGGRGPLRARALCDPATQLKALNNAVGGQTNARDRVA